MKTKLIRTKAEVEADKRTAVPWKTTWVCDDCKESCEIDHADYYFSYPTWGENQEIELECDCGYNSGTVIAKLDVIMKIVEVIKPEG